MFTSTIEKTLVRSLSFLEIPYIRLPLLLILVLYLLTDIPMIHRNVDMILHTTIGKLIVLLFIIYLSHKDVALSILLALVLIRSMKETFEVRDINSVQTGSRPMNDNFPPESSRLNMTSEYGNEYGKIQRRPDEPILYESKDDATDPNSPTARSDVSRAMESFETNLFQESQRMSENEIQGAPESFADNCGTAPKKMETFGDAMPAGAWQKDAMPAGAMTRGEGAMSADHAPGATSGFNVPDDGAFGARSFLNSGISTMNPQISAQSLNHMPTGSYDLSVYAPY
jgi:hypothetical protein